MIFITRNTYRGNTMNVAYITEQSGARWVVSTTNAQGGRAFWVFLVSGQSVAKPHVLGFYAASVAAACDALNN